MYRFDFFDRVINGDLSPADSGIKGFNKNIEFLKIHYSVCIKHYKIRVKISPEGEYIIKNVIEYGCFELLKLDKDLLFSKERISPPESLIIYVCSIININETDIVNVYFKSGKTISYLEITALSDFSKLSPNEARFLFYSTQLYEETERVKTEIQKEIFNIKSEEEICLFIRNHQRAIESLILLVCGKIEEKDKTRIYDISKSYDILDIFKLLHYYLNEIMEFVAKNYTKYIDFNTDMPYSVRLYCVMEIEEKTKYIKPILKEKLTVQFYEIVLVPLNKLVAINANEKLTYRDFIYNHLLFDAINSNLNDPSKLISDDLLHEILFSQNYNSFDYFDFLTEIISKELNQNESFVKKAEKLFLYIKKYQQHVVRSLILYNPNMPSLKDQVLSWLYEELNYLNNLNNIANIATENKQVLKKQLIETNLSVAQLSYIAKLATETGLINNRNNRDIFRFIAANLKTNKVQEISIDSIGSKFYNVDDSTKEVVKEILIKLLNHIKRN